MNPTRRLALALPVLAVAAAGFAVPAATAQAAEPTGIVQDKTKPQPKADTNTGKCTKGGSDETVAIAGGRKVTTIIACNKAGDTPTVTTIVERRTPPNRPPIPIPPKAPIPTTAPGDML
ncbi:hypothetical protein [Streptomyces boluensis]|uniref:Secreted protein n=1 Tax=Streptomyces boluensis TaxID=1775135 RepID=A0A964UKT5_9ACTN|nr:hypothetical protein [Streptomyces boluensis]NBE51048.1 hypothetical protein [Streptomyces boluensis]